MAKRYFEGAQHTLNYALFRPKPPSSLIKTIISKTEKRVSFACLFLYDVRKTLSS